MKSLLLELENASAPRRLVSVGADCVFGGSEIVVIAGPCAVESPGAMAITARSVRATGARMLRGGACTPGTARDTLQDPGEPALEWLATAGREVDLPVVTEVTDPRHVERIAASADMLQIGSRNMHNRALLAEVASMGKPILLKRGLAATMREFLLASEHLRARGTDAIILCERGIRTFETASRFTLDLTVIPLLREATDLPIIVDPSHAGGRAKLVAPLAGAAIAAGADGLLVEVHQGSSRAFSDADQALSFREFAEVMGQIARGAAAVGRWIAAPEPDPGP